MPKTSVSLRRAGKGRLLRHVVGMLICDATGCETVTSGGVTQRSSLAGCVRSPSSHPPLQAADLQRGVVAKALALPPLHIQPSYKGSMLPVNFSRIMRLPHHVKLRCDPSLQHWHLRPGRLRLWLVSRCQGPGRLRLRLKVFSRCLRPGRMKLRVFSRCRDPRGWSSGDCRT